MRDFIYIDEQILRMYYTELPKKEQLKFRKGYSRTDIEVILSLPPQIKTKEFRPELPYDAAVALSLFLEDYIRADHQMGNLDTLEGEFVEGVMGARYATIKSKEGDDILVAFPQEGIPECIKNLGKSYFLVGDARKYWSARDYPLKEPPGPSALRRLADVFGYMQQAIPFDICGLRPPRNHYGGISGGRAINYTTLYHGSHGNLNQGVYLQNLRVF